MQTWEKPTIPIECWAMRRSSRVMGRHSMRPPAPICRRPSLSSAHVQGLAGMLFRRGLVGLPKPDRGMKSAFIVLPLYFGLLLGLFEHSVAVGAAGGVG